MAELLSELDRQAVVAGLQQTFDAQTSEVLLRAIERVVALHDGRVLRAEMDELKQAVTNLAAAQARTEQRVEELAAAQARSEDRLTRVEAAVEKLAEAQARTEERLTRVEAAVEKLAEAQARTEQAVSKLAEAVDQLGKQVGGLSDNFGGDIEDIAYIVLYHVLKREFNWEVGELRRMWHKWDDKLEEVNVFGRATDPARPGQRIWIVGEAKHNLTIKEVEKFATQVERARRKLEGEIFPVCFCYRARPEVEEQVKAAGIHLVFSYGKLIQAG